MKKIKFPEGKKQVCWILLFVAVLIAVVLLGGRKLLPREKNIQKFGWLEGFDKLHATLQVLLFVLI